MITAGRMSTRLDRINCTASSWSTAILRYLDTAGWGDQCGPVGIMGRLALFPYASVPFVFLGLAFRAVFTRAGREVKTEGNFLL